MSWPLSQDYNEAIQTPAGNFADPDLRRGEAATNALGIPMPYSGNFADVYQVRCPDGSRWAVKCFTREAPGLRERYAEISKHLRRANLPFMVDFTYLEQGIRVLGRWYPVLKMQWVEGLTLNQFVKQYADRPVTLEALLQTWTRMAKALRAAQIGHGDLQHGNVLLVPGPAANSLALKLIDYDGMWVPALAGTKSGEVGHPSYQHPQRIREGTYSIEVDRFPVLLIATALRALKAGGRGLWDRYDNGDNLLFKETDLRAPQQSALMQELLHLGDAATAALLVPLFRSLSGGLASAPTLEEVMPDSRPTPVPTPVPRPVAAATVAAPLATRSPWDFAQPGAAAFDSSRTRPTPARARGVPRWAWAAVIALLIVSLGTAAGVALVINAGRSAQTPDNRVSQNDRGAKNSPPSDPASLHSDKGGIRSAPPSPEPPEPPKPAEPPEPPKPIEEERSITNSIGMKLVLIPAGRFTMGSPANEQGHHDNEGPQHEVEISRPFYMGAYPVTKGQFAAFVNSENYKTESESDVRGGFAFSAAAGKWEQRPEFNWRRPGFDQTDDDPVADVTWNDAVRFYQWLSKKEGRTYELPTEAEWEYACRAGTSASYAFGDNPKVLGDYAWFSANSSRRTHPVGTKKPNQWGLYDMGGNVWQWCADRYANYQSGAVKDPKGTDTGDVRVTRGGAWYCGPLDCRPACRGHDPSNQSLNHGFRVVLRPAEAAPRPEPAPPSPSGPQVTALKGHSGWVFLVLFSPDGTRLASVAWDVPASSKIGEVKLWDAQTGKELHALTGYSGIVLSACYSSDGQRLAAYSSDGKALEWDTASGQVIRTFEGAGKGEGLVCYSPDGKFLAGAGNDGGVMRTAKVWDAASGQEVFTLKFTGFARELCYSPDGSRLALASGGLVQQGGVVAGEVKVWDTRSGQVITTLKSPGGFSSASFSADSKRIVTGTEAFYDQGKLIAGEVKVSDVRTGEKLLSLGGHTGGVVKIWFTPDGKRIASAGSDGMAIVWDAATGQSLLTTHDTQGVVRVCLSGDDGRLVTSFYQGLKIWRVPSTPNEGAPAQPVVVDGETGGVHSMCFSPDSTLIATGSNDGVVRLWRLDKDH